VTYAGDNQQDCTQDICQALAVEVLGLVLAVAHPGREWETGRYVQSGPQKHPEEVQVVRPLFKEGKG
jgi:hypothetical protein